MKGQQSTRQFDAGTPPSLDNKLHLLLKAMPLKICKVSQFVKYTLQIILVGTWLGLTGLKIAHFLSEPTAVQSRLDHKFKPPSITVLPSPLLPKEITRIVRHGSDEERQELFGNQTFFDFISEHALALEEVVGGVTNKTEENRAHKRNETTLKDGRGTWKLTTYVDIQVVITLHPTRSTVTLTLPRRSDILEGLDSDDYCYWITLHREEDFWSYDPDFHTYLVLKNVSYHQDIKVTIEREVRLDLRRQPCEKDPAYFKTNCMRKCFLSQLNCSMGSADTGDTNMKPPCMASYYLRYMMELNKFFRDNGDTEKSPIEKCGCPRPCITDRISYTPLADVTKSTNDSLKVYIRMSRVRRTKMTVLTYGLEDLLADVGGYLGLLLGVSLLSLCGGGRRLAGRLVRRARRRRHGRRAAAEAGEGAERAWSLEKEEAPSTACHDSPEHDGWSRRHHSGSHQELS